MGRLETLAVFCPHAKPGDVRACRPGPLEPTGLRPTPRLPLFLLTDGRSKWPVEQEGLVYPGRGRLGEGRVRVSFPRARPQVPRFDDHVERLSL